MEAKLLLDAKAQLGEGALWDEREQVLYWIDIMGKKLHRYNPATQNDEVFNVGQHVGTVVLDESGGILLAVQSGFARFDLETEKLDIIVNPESHIEGNRFNDGKVDPGGRFWAGTMSYNATPHAGSLYCLDIDGTVHIKETDVTISNGIVWTADHQTMYYVDSTPRVITAFDYEKATGNISNGKIVIKVPQHMGSPDGIAIDSKGQLWVAHWGYGAVVCWCPKTGEIMQEIKVPASNTSACAFGGADMKTLYITTARIGLSDEKLADEPLSGGLFIVETDVVGLATYRYQG